MRNMIPVVTIVEYVQTCVELNTLSRAKEHLRAVLIAALRSGAKVPSRSPYELQVVVRDRVAVDWKAAYLDLAQKVYGAKALDQIRALEEAAHKPVEYLEWEAREAATKAASEAA